MPAPHCIAFECLLNGSNHAAEKEARPLELCPLDLAKLCWNVGCDPKRRAARLAEFLRAQGLDVDARRFEAERDLL